jgi:putative DNA methylase
MNDQANLLTTVPNTTPVGWHSRGYLPHFDAGPVPQIITIRLIDSFPRARLEQWSEELKVLPRHKAEAERRRRIEEYLDKGFGSSWLETPDIARIVEDSMLFFDGQRYRLHAWVIMPNHVHALLTPLFDSALSEILHSWKSFSAKKANRFLQRSGGFWQDEYFDRLIRSEKHFRAAVEYIENNPMKAGLCTDPADWSCSSARLRNST